ncbi:MAG: SEC-C metal-binding domain-containing protein, partial [Bacteroidales bacterium]
MIKKIGRNEPCPCGSGKKYKNCCINAGLVKENKEKLESIEKERNETLRYIESHSSGLILNTIISLQLMPENHGKNVRIEELAKHIATNLNSHEDSNLELFKSYLDKEYSKNMMEDIPENLFCENIVFFGGNYPVFSGISSYSIEILRNLSETIFSYKNDLPTEFTSHVYSGLKLMLELGQILANKLNIKGNIPGIETERKFNYLKNNLDFSIDKNEIQSICEDYGIEPSIINDFIISPNDEKYKFEDIDLNPLLYYPIVQFDNKYYYLLISNQANTLNEFILRLSGFYKCNQKLVSLYHDNNWREIWHACDRMNWQLTDIKIPVDKSATIKERIFQFDTNRLAFVSYLHNNKTNSRYERYEERYVDDSSDINDRIQEVINYLKTNKNFKDFKFLSLITYDNIGQELFLGINGPQENELRLTFASSQFIQLSTTEKWNTLSLWKFAKTFESFSKTTRTISDTLDIYSLYAAKEESLYFSDDAPANILTVVPGDGSRLTKESKLKQNLHGIIALIDNRLAYVPTTRSADYAPLYEPIHTLEFYAICLEIYDFPVWISNRQIKNNSMTKTVRTYAEAIGFWLFKLEPMIKSPLNKIINKPLEIEITLDDEFFKNEPVPEMKNNPSDDTYSFHYESNKIQFYVPHETLYSLQVINNEGERTMMKTLLSSFNLIDNLFSYEEITIAIDNAIPLGNAKMILLSHTQKDLMIDNRWLIRPLYISKAEINMILDELPILIEEKIKVPENIESTEKKKELFNIATTILLDKLHTEINVFDFEFLLDCLIELHETLVWKRENNKTIIPAQILCFGDREGKVNEILDNEIRLANTSLSLRCLIEYVASSPTKGSIKSSNDDIDRLLALMHEIVTYGFLSDSIHFKMNNPKVGKLKSGRIGISRDFFDDKLRPFSVAHTKEEIDNYIENFDSRFHSFDTSPKPAIETDGDAELDLINNA